MTPHELVKPVPHWTRSNRPSLNRPVTTTRPQTPLDGCRQVVPRTMRAISFVWALAQAPHAQCPPGHRRQDDMILQTRCKIMRQVVDSSLL